MSEIHLLDEQQLADVVNLIMQNMQVDTPTTLAQRIKYDVSAFGDFLNIVHQIRKHLVHINSGEMAHAQTQHVLNSIHEDGFCQIPGLFSDTEFLEQARKRTIEATNMALDIHKNQLAVKPGMEHEEGLGFDQPSNSYYCPNSGLPFQGRARAHWRPSYPGMQKSQILLDVFNHPLVQDVYKKYLSPLHQDSEILMERVEPAYVSDIWHIDKYSYQLKMAILLTDVTFKHGPTRYKRGTHICNNFDKAKLIHDSFFLNDLAYNYPTAPVVGRMPEETVYFTGKAGDAVFFETHGIHSGTRCLEGERLLLMVYPHCQDVSQQIMDVFRS